MELDRLKESIVAIVRSVFPSIDALALYPAKVLGQNGDGSLELQPDDARIAGLSNVPIRYGVPGVKATIASGARVLLGFEGGDRSKPVATLWESASVTRLVVSAGAIELAGADEPVALADTLETLLGQVRTWLSTHTHPTAVGSSGPPAQAPALPIVGELGSSVAKVKR
jgi:hypothetical protein